MQRVDHTRRVRRMVAAFLIGATVVAVVVFGTRQLVTAPARHRLAAVRNAAARARAAGYYRLWLESRLVGSDGVLHVATSSSEVDVAAQRSHGDLALVADGRRAEIITQGRIAYLAVPAARQAALGGAHWIRVNAGNETAAAGAGVGPLPDPGSIVATLDGATWAGSPSRRGANRVYAFRASSTELAKRRGHPALGAAKVLYTLGPGLLRGEVTVDGKGQPVTVTVHSTLGGRGRLDLRLDVSAIGEQIDVGVPADSEVTTAPSLADGLRLLSG